MIVLAIVDGRKCVVKNDAFKPVSKTRIWFSTKVIIQAKKVFQFGEEAVAKHS